MNLFCFGYGYSAEALGRHLASRGDVVLRGTRRAANDGDARILPFDGMIRSDAIAAAVHTSTHVLVSIPPDDAGCPALRCFANALVVAPSLSTIAYLSTVGVYGDHGGAWIDESTPPAPTSQRARRRLLAETQWQAFAAQTGKRLDIFRLPGIYGPGRSAFDQLRAGTAKRIVKPGQVFNRIHVDDIAGALACAMTSSPRQRVFNLSDDEPSPPQDVIAFAARLLGVEPPPEVPYADARLSPMSASFYAENKRVSNARMKTDLGYALRHPSYREGLAAILATEQQGLPAL